MLAALHALSQFRLQKRLSNSCFMWRKLYIRGLQKVNGKWDYSKNLVQKVFGINTDYFILCVFPWTFSRTPILVTGYFLNSFFKNCIFIWKLQGKKVETERERFHPLVHPLNGCNNQVWARQRPGVRNSSRVSAQVAGVQGLGPSSAASQEH